MVDREFGRPPTWGGSTERSVRIYSGGPKSQSSVLLRVSRGFAYCRRPPNRDGPTERAPKEEVPELRNSSFSDFRQNRRKTNFLRWFLKNPSVESVTGEHTQLFTFGWLTVAWGWLERTVGAFGL